MINQELAEVDRGIEATSARLAKLALNSQQSINVAATRFARQATPAVPSSGSTTTGDEKQSASQPAIQNAVTTAEAPTSSPVASPSPEAAATPRPSSAPEASEARTTGTDVLQVAQSNEERVDRSGPASAPIRSVLGLNASVKQTLPRGSEFAASASQDVHKNRLTDQGGPVPGARESGDVTLVPDPLRPTAAPTVDAGATDRRVAPVSERQHEKHVTPYRRRESSIAPWPNVNPPHRSSDLTSADEQSRSSGSSEANQGTMSSGTVMLDGRLVGEWLMDRMTRDASRPPSGTTFFDPRQTPAWSVSGAP